MTCTGLSKASCKWADQTAVDYSSFSSGFPDDRFGKCVYYSADGIPASQWASGPCEELLPYVCELPTTTNDSIYDCNINYNNHCYHKDADPLYFSWAQQNCARELFNNGNLVSVHSYLENRFITSLYQNFEGNVWLGGMAPGASLIIWADGSKNDYYNLKDVANGICLAMTMHIGDSDVSNTGDWVSYDCTSEFVYLCKRPTCSLSGTC